MSDPALESLYREVILDHYKNPRGHGVIEDADAEAQGTKGAVETTEPDIEEDVEMDESLDDAAFIEEQEEEDADVTDIIGGDIEDEEEG